MDSVIPFLAYASGVRRLTVRSRSGPKSAIGTALEAIRRAIGLGLLGAIACGGSGCGHHASDSGRDLLFSRGGREFGNPTERLWGALLRAEEGRGEDRILAHILDVLERPGGYSRLVAARALLQFYGGHQNPRVPGPRASRAIAKHVVQMSQPLPPGSVPDSTIRNAPPLALASPINVRCAMVVDGVNHVLEQHLPVGWRGADGRVWLDGKEVARTDGIYEVVSPALPLEIIPIEHLLKGETMYGEHVLVSRLVLLAPGGLRIPIERTLKFRVRRSDRREQTPQTSE